MPPVLLTVLGRLAAGLADDGFGEAGLEEKPGGRESSLELLLGRESSLELLLGRESSLELLLGRESSQTEAEGGLEERWVVEEEEASFGEVGTVTDGGGTQIGSCRSECNHQV